MGKARILQGDVVRRLKELGDESVNCVVTSPPYWGMRDYGADGQIGLEESLEDHIARMVEVFREVRRVLRSDGVMWMNYGDSYAANQGNGWKGQELSMSDEERNTAGKVKSPVKPKNLLGLPWRVALALQGDGWYLRSDVIWHKPNPMPESASDRPTKSHEYVFLMSKSSSYWYDADAIREPAEQKRVAKRGDGGIRSNELETLGLTAATGRTNPSCTHEAGKNVRTVWSIPTEAMPDAHFATFPQKLAHRCILAGCPEGGVVLDPFSGSGTTAYVAAKNGRQGIGIELNPEYVDISIKRIKGDMFIELEVDRPELSTKGGHVHD